jgi:alpha-glucosidase
MRDTQISNINEFITIADIKVILDFVPNHSSDEHEWFVKSAQKEAIYSDYYVWHDGKVGANGTRIPPNNWVSPVHVQLHITTQNVFR